MTQLLTIENVDAQQAVFEVRFQAPEPQLCAAVLGAHGGKEYFIRASSCTRSRSVACRSCKLARRGTPRRTCAAGCDSACEARAHGRRLWRRCAACASHWSRPTLWQPSRSSCGRPGLSSRWAGPRLQRFHAHSLARGAVTWEACRAWVLEPGIPAPLAAALGRRALTPTGSKLLYA